MRRPRKCTVLFALATLLFKPVLAAGPMTLEQLSALEQVGAASASPNGAWVAYLKGVPRTPYVDEDGAAWSELHVVDLDGVSRPYITGQESVGHIEWAADSRSIYFLSQRNEEPFAALYRIALDGGEAQQLIKHDNNIENFRISPDGRYAALLAKQAPPALKEELALKGFKAEVYEEDLQATRIWMVDLHADPEMQLLELPGSASALYWSPGSDALAVALAPTPLVDDSLVARSIVIIDAASGERRATIGNVGKLGGGGGSHGRRKVHNSPLCPVSDRTIPGKGT